MSSVSLTVPFIPDLVKFNKRGLAYSIIGLLMSLAVVSMYICLSLNLHKDFNEAWFFVISGLTGIATALTFCWHFKDNYKHRMRKRQ